MFRILNPSDKRLVQQVLAGQRDRFGVLVARHQGLVHAVAYAQTNNATDAEDVVQDAFLKAYESLHTLREGARFGPWVAMIARRVAYEYVRRRQRRARASEQACAGKGVVEPTVEKRDMEGVLRSQMDGLRPEQREILFLRYYAGKSVKEVAQALEITPGTAAKRLQRAREALGDRLVTALGESRETRAVARKRLARVMGAVAVADVVWAGSAGATSALAGPSSLLNAKVVFGILAAVVVIIGSWRISTGPAAPLAAPTRSDPPAAAAPGPREEPSEDATQESKPVGPQREVGDAVADADLRCAIGGRVYVRETGAGVAGAEVRVAPKARRDGSGPLVAVTDQTGAYCLRGLSSGEYRIRLEEMDGYSSPSAFESRALVLEAGAEMAALDFALSRGCPIRGKVVDSTGGPLSPGEVSGWTADYRYTGSSRIENDGSFEISGIAESSRVFVQPRKEGYALAPQGPFDLPPEGIDALVLTMVGEGTVSGVVVDEGGAPIEGVDLSFRPDVGQGSGFRVEPSGPDGRFLAHGLFPATYRVTLQLPDDGQWLMPEGGGRVAITEGEHLRGIRLVCPSGNPHLLTLAGRVVDAQGAPLSWAYVIAERPTWSETKTGRDGAFLLDDLRNADYELIVWHKEYAPVRLQSVPAGMDDLEVVLEARGSIEGRVVDAATGSPVTDFEILDWSRRAHYNGQASYVRISNGEGRFALTGVEPGQSAVIVRAKGYAPTSSEPIPVRSGKTTRDVIARLKPARVVEGLVLNPEGRPTGEAHIYLAEEMAFHYMMLDHALAVTGADGRFTLESVPVDAAHIVAWHPRYAAARTSIPKGTGKAEATLKLRPGGVVKGVVRAAGVPIPNVRVQVGDSGLYVANTSESGAYSVAGLCSGYVDVSVNPTFGEGGSWYGRKQTRSVVVEEGATVRLDFDFDLWLTEVQGRITVNGEGSDLGELSVYLKYEDVSGFSGMFYTKTDEAGYFRLDGVPPGLAILEVVGGGVGGRERPAMDVNISADGLNDLVFDIVHNHGETQ